MHFGYMYWIFLILRTTFNFIIPRRNCFLCTTVEYDTTTIYCCQAGIKQKLYVVVWNVSVVEKRELRLSNTSRTSMKRQNFGVPYWSHSVYWQYCCLMLQYCSLLAETGNKYMIWSSFVWNCRVLFCFFNFICFIWKFLTFLFSILTPRLDTQVFLNAVQCFACMFN